MLDPEALLLVDDDQAEVLEPDLVGEQSVGADDDVDAAVSQALDDRRRLGVALEPRECLDRHRELQVTVREGLQVLLHQQGCRHEHGHLLAVLHGLEGRPHRDLGLAVADIAADEPVHGDLALHVGLDLVDRGQLVGRLDIGEGVLELTLPGRVWPESVTGRGHPRRVELDEVGRDLLDVLAGLGLGLGPVRSPQPMQGRRLTADIAGHLVELIGRHVEPVPGLATLARGILQHDVFAGGAADGALHHLDEAAHAVLFVDDEVARPQRQRVDLGPAPGRHPPHVARRGPRAGRPGEVTLGDDDQLPTFVEEPGPQRGGRDDGHAGGRHRRLGLHPRGDPEVVQHLMHSARQARPLGDEDNRAALLQPPADVSNGPLGVTAVGRGVAQPEVHPGHLVGLVDEVGQLLVGREGRELPPRHTEPEGLLPQLRE